MEPKKTIITRWFQNDDYTPMAQIIVSFCFGVLLSPWATGIFFLVIFIILYEAIFYLFTWGQPQYWQIETRAGVITATLLGWIIGRTVSGQEIFPGSLPDLG